MILIGDKTSFPRIYCVYQCLVQVPVQLNQEIFIIFDMINERFLWDYKGSKPV